MRFQDLFEVSIIQQLHNQPIRDSDTVRVYHGTSDLDFVISAIKYGATGSSYAKRRYSYEANNNPKGIFVTPDLSVAKNFGPYILEFHTRVRDLEAPVWPGGSFTSPGQLSGIFDSEDDREQERLRQRMRWSQSEYEFVRNSDRPELAALFLMGGERQALFTGDLNRNSIRAIWASTDPSRINQPHRRMSTGDFMDAYDADTSSDVMRSAKKKLVAPRDDVSGEEFIELVTSRFRSVDRQEAISIFKKSPQTIKDYVWSDRQANRIASDIRRM